MVRHIVMWNFRKGLTDEQNEKNALRIKAELEGLVDKIDEIKSLSVEIRPLATSNRGILLNSLFDSEESLASYQTHPEHVKVSSFIRSVMQDRACMDYCE